MLLPPRKEYPCVLVLLVLMLLTHASYPCFLPMLLAPVLLAPVLLAPMLLVLTPQSTPLPPTISSHSSPYLKNPTCISCQVLALPALILVNKCPSPYPSTHQLHLIR